MTRRRGPSIASPGAALAALLAAAGCDPALTVTVVTVEARPAVREVETLEVTFANDNATLSTTFDVDGRAFPLTFSVETPGRDGEVEMTARALDDDGGLVALGVASATVVPDGEAAAALVLEPADFAVNTDVGGSQRLSWSRASAGLQVAAAPDGTFTIGFTDDCGQLVRCDVFGRRYDAAGVPQVTAKEASAAQFTINVTDILGYDPTLAVGPDGGMLAAWSTLDEIVAVAVTPEGSTPQGLETVVSTGEPSIDDPAVAALPDGRFVVVWVETDAGTGQARVLGRFLDAGGAPTINPNTGTTAPFTISTSTGATPSQPAVVATGDGLELGFVWRVGSSLRVRFTNASGLVIPSQELPLADFNVLDDVWTPRITTTADGRFEVAWAYRTSNGPADDGAIVVRKIAQPIAVQVGVDAYVARGLPDAFTGFGLASDGQGALAVAWQACGAAGDGNGCGIRARVFRDTGLPVGDEIVVNTTTAGDQTTPAIASIGGGAWTVAWTDDSRTPPDTDLTGIRARVIYPPFVDAQGVIGARCGGAGDAPCPDGTACFAGSDDTPRCHATCDPDGPVPHCPGGGVCTTAANVSACVL